MRSFGPCGASTRDAISIDCTTPVRKTFTYEQVVSRGISTDCTRNCAYRLYGGFPQVISLDIHKTDPSYSYKNRYYIYTNKALLIRHYLERLY